MKTLLQRKLVIKKSPIAGFGVFANEDFAKGDLIEECYTLKTHTKYPEFINYLFANTKNSWLLPLGAGAIYNHSSTPNADYEFDPENSLIRFHAKKIINKDEEILIDYGDDWFNDRKIKEKKTSRKFRIKQVVKTFQWLLRFVLIVVVLLSVILILQKI